MSAGVITAVLLAAAIAAALWWFLRRRGRPAQTFDAPAAPADDFERMSAAERIDFVFALGALDDASALPMLERALGDSNEAVALAAARTLTGMDAARVESYFAGNPAARETIAAMVSS